METLIEILTRTGVGVFGLWFYVIFTVWSNGNLKAFNLKTHYLENKNHWILSILMILTLAVLLEIIPAGGELIKGSTGFAVTEEIASFFSLGYIFGSGVRKIMNKNNSNEIQ